MVMCEQVWANISAYLDEELAAELRVPIEEHVRGCSKCAAVVHGVQNIVALYGDERFIPLPEGYSRRLRQRIDANTQKRSTPVWGWAAAFAAVALFVGALTLGRPASFNSPEVKSQLAQPGIHVPAQLQVVVEPKSKLFHVMTCRAIHDRQHLQAMTSQEAIRQGYAPCPRCMKEYLKLAEKQGPVFAAFDVPDLH